MMHYEPKYDKFHSGPFVMPFLSIPTGMTRPHAVRPDEQPPSTTTMEASSSTDFVLGIDTCGFTTSSTSELPLSLITDASEHELSWLTFGSESYL